MAVVIGAEWAVAMQQDQDVIGDPKSLELQQSCFTGSWAGDVVRGGHNPNGDGLTLSAGDLDEAIQSFLIFRDTDKISAGTGATAFENVDAFRTRVLPGRAVLRRPRAVGLTARPARLLDWSTPLRRPALRARLRCVS